MSRRLVSLALALAVLVLPGSAHAEVVRGPEPVGDTIAWSVAGMTDPFCGTPAAVDSPPEAAGSDLVGISVRHKRYVVALTARFAAPQPRSWRDLVFHVETPRARWLFEFTRKGQERFVEQVPEPTWKLEGWDTDGDGTDDCQIWEGTSGWTPCPDRPHAVVSADRLALTITVKRHCLGNPRWIRAGAESQGANEQIVFTDTWDPSAPDVRDTDFDPRVHIYGHRVLAGPQADLAAPSTTPGRVVRHTVTRSANGFVVP